LAVNIRGAAGTGKTALLQDLHRGLNESRRGVVAVAPTTGAVEELQKVGFPEAMTVARLLADPQQRHELAGQVLIVDEAGMVSSKDMAELIDLVKDKGARIVYSGDTAQIKSVSEGDALRVLERESNLRACRFYRSSGRRTPNTKRPSRLFAFIQRKVSANWKPWVQSVKSIGAYGLRKSVRRTGRRPLFPMSRERSDLYW
jgi:hypothetical protein